MWLIYYVVQLINSFETNTTIIQNSFDMINLEPHEGFWENLNPSKNY
jgi:hypothetical protein